ncbi:hypothetical protein ATL39_2982 [Sinobaca qinghaiensis]|uniref:Uncharacterized protein n=1 Tax=Sinobaca qinghaiensis TaxID=342944 RepID=A0A419UWP3_9BACL|nr:hypothetical protein ATL39_2982 [Sinobaca qinghaiensis]
MKFLAHRAPFFILGTVFISFLITILSNNETLITVVNVMSVLLILLLYISISKYPKSERNWLSDKR